MSDPWLKLTERIADLGAEHRADPPDDEFDDDDLIAVARRIAAEIGVTGALPHHDTVDLDDLRNAYNDGLQPELIDFGQVAAELASLGVAAEIVNTGGGTATLYAGPPTVDDDGTPRRLVALGPGDFWGRNDTQPAGYIDQLTYGTLTHGEDAEDGDTAKSIAQAIADMVARETAPRFRLGDQPQSYLMDCTIAWFIADGDDGEPTLYVANYYDMGSSVDWSESIPAAEVGDWTNTRWAHATVTPELIFDWHTQLAEIGLINNSQPPNGD